MESKWKVQSQSLPDPSIPKCHNSESLLRGLRGLRKQGLGLPYGLRGLLTDPPGAQTHDEGAVTTPSAS